MFDKVLIDLSMSRYLLSEGDHNLKKAIKSRLDSNLEYLYVSAHTVAELMLASKIKALQINEYNALQAFIKGFQVVSYCEDVASRDAEIRYDLTVKQRLKGKAIQAITVAATAQAFGFTILTAKEDEYRGIPNLNIADWRIDFSHTATATA